MFGLFKSASYSDSQLGTLERSKGKWRGTINLPSQGGKPLALSGNRNQPDPDSLNLAHQLPSKYLSLIPAIQKALFEHYEPYSENAEAEGNNAIPQVKNDQSLWDQVKLAGILIEPLEGAPTIEIAYEVAWDNEHTLGARIQDWKLVELNGSILT